MVAKFYPKAELKISGRDGGRYVGGPARGVLHTTETSNWAGQAYYHVAAKLENGVVKWQQYTPFTVAARGLRHPAGTVDTNRMGDFCIQVSIVGFSKDAQDRPEVVYDELGRFMRWAESEYGIQPVAPDFFGPEAYGVASVSRMSEEEWARFNGWCGHQHVPHNSHWDPGKIRIEHLLGIGKGDDKVRELIALLQQKLNDHGFDAGPVDGLLGPKTAQGIDAMLDAVVKGEANVKDVVALQHDLAVLEGRVNKLREI